MYIYIYIYIYRHFYLFFFYSPFKHGQRCTRAGINTYGLVCR